MKYVFKIEMFLEKIALLAVTPVVVTLNAKLSPAFAVFAESPAQ